jgi:hypothetical protein
MKEERNFDDTRQENDHIGISEKGKIGKRSGIPLLLLHSTGLLD